ncbi:MAG: helix-turn-helix transcriptional regulator [Planctomycetes bacterium]|nr:helix-turn-helix transcriptional regulator [Planctomycetota bacterium]
MNVNTVQKRTAYLPHVRLDLARRAVALALRVRQVSAWTGVALPSCHLAFQARKPRSEAYPKELRTLGDHIRKCRLDLALTQKDVAERLGANETSVWNRERNRSSPALCFIPRIIEFLGYAPDDTKPETLGQKIVAWRRLRGLTQKELARRLGVDPSTIASWERGENRPIHRLANLLGQMLGDVT